MVISGDYILEHRAVMAIYLGRPLDSTEVVHHLNGNKSDNHVENLVVCPRSSHNAKHTEILKQLSYLTKHIKELEDENSKLKLTLSTDRVHASASI